MADLWHPIPGICILDMGEKQFIFQFFHEVDVQRVLARTPWFFNNHLLLLHRIQLGESPSLVPLNLLEFWVQIHDLPSSLMTESMAKQFGVFLGQFIDYDTSFRSMNFQSFMRIWVRLDVTILLKKKKKILIGKDRIDISLRAAVRRRNATISKWLREADGSECNLLDKEREFRGQNLGNENDFGSSRGGELAKSFPNPNFIPLGSGQIALNKGIDKWLNMVNRELYGADNGHGPMELQLDEENDPLHALEGKKRQRVVNDLVNLSSNNSDGGVNDILASFAEQSSRAQ
ncbi:hypothetical protein Gogos_017815 [Gossypium gossypioides]|uniref:DUF4283 domain-containing protein n=1 Tax=Gossypium gossypioides TaxID=34282 RepID=A0A7J9BC21_GOSGO|nr:hypothetical protein [Gossypium gossypioides]